VRHGTRLLCVLVAVGSVYACTEVGTDPNVPVAIEIDPLQLPAIAEGDSLRDTLGVVRPIVARALNSRNEVIPGAPISFLALRNDSAIIAVDSTTGAVAGLRVGDADVVARIGGLQSVRLPVRVTLTPDSVYAISPLVDSVLYNLADDTARTLAVRVAQHATVNGRDTLLPVPFWRVRYTIVDPPELAANTDTTRVYIANESNRLSRVDTTSAAEGASRRIRFPVAVVSDTTRRTFVTEVVALGADGTPLPGSPVLFTTVIRPR
jgi:DNA-binding beta-propeller fold protein YncE